MTESEKRIEKERLFMAFKASAYQMYEICDEKEWESALRKMKKILSNENKLLLEMEAGGWYDV